MSYAKSIVLRADQAGQSERKLRSREHAATIPTISTTHQEHDAMEAYYLHPVTWHGSWHCARRWGYVCNRLVLV